MQGFEPVENAGFPVFIENLTVHYGRKKVLNNVTFRAYPGKINVIIGQSGSGKSTMLRHALGLRRFTSGTIRLFGREVEGMSDQELRDTRIRIGVLFQSGALFSSMSVGENIALVIKENTNLPGEVIAEMAQMKLALVGLKDAIGKYPENLSGGMRKRAALARAIATDPEILFCDEPSAGLDPVVASELDDLLISLNENFNMTMVVVTHDIESIKKIAHRVAMLDGGKIIAEGPLDEVMANPNTVVQDFFNRVSHADEKVAQSRFFVSHGEVR